MDKGDGDPMMTVIKCSGDLIVCCGITSCACANGFVVVVFAVVCLYVWVLFFLMFGQNVSLYSC